MNVQLTPRGSDQHLPKASSRIGAWWRSGVLIFTVPIVAIGLSLFWVVRSGWVPRNDRAFVQLRVLDVGSSATPIVGMPSTASQSVNEIAHHLGPAQFWLLAAPFRVVSWLTDSPASLSIASAAVSAGAIGLVGWCVHRQRTSSRDLWMACSFVCAGLWQASVATAVSPWNPDFAFVMLLSAATACVASLARGSTLAITATIIALASISAQAHLSYAVPSTVVAAIALISFVRTAPSAHRWRHRAILTAMVVIVWIGPIIDALTNAGGNIVTVASISEGDGLGLVGAFDRFAHSLEPWRFGLRTVRDGQLFSQTANWFERIVALLALVGVATIATNNKTAARHLARVAFALTTATIISASVAPESFATVFASHVQRVWILPTLLIWATLAVVGLHLFQARAQLDWARRRQTLTILAVVPMAMLMANAGFSGERSGSRQPPCSDAVTDLAHRIDPVVHGADTYDSRAISFSVLGLAQDITTGLYAELVRRGANLTLLADTDPEMISDHYFQPQSATALTSIVIEVERPDLVSTREVIATASCRYATDAVTVAISVRSQP